jgi:WhiB family transcriptional regulator, redox-sensing transcriptional regulator
MISRRIVTEVLAGPPHPYDTNPDWQKDGACCGKGPDLWFPPRGTPYAKILEAKRICSDCPIKQKCLDYALWHGDRAGIWGGKTEKERRNLRLSSTVVRPPGRKRITTEWVNTNDDETTQRDPSTPWQSLTGILGAQMDRTPTI